MALSDSFTKTIESDESRPSKEQGPSGRRRQLHILYLMNDLVHHARYHSDSSSIYSTFISDLQSYLRNLFRSASTCNSETYPNQHRKIQELLDIWENNGYYHSSYIEELRETVADAAKSDSLETGRGPKIANGAQNEALGEEKKDTPFIMPASHGDPSTPFYDLPAGNILPHIMPNSSTPINPQLVKPLQFVSGPADESLVNIVKDFLQKVETLDDSGFGDEGIDVDLDEMGQCVLRDEITGEVLEGDGYYGWSRAFCEKMKRRGENVEDFAKAIGRDDSLDRSLSPRKRRRYSDSGRSPSIGTGRSSSLNSRDGRRYGPRSRSRSRSASTEQRQHRRLRSQSRSKSRSPSYSPPQIISAFQQPSLANNASPSSQAHVQGSSPPPPPFLHPFSQGFPMGPGGVPIPPPPPPNYQGQWPPPPPPMPNSAATGPLNFVPPSPQLVRPRTYHKQRGASFMQGPQSSVQGQTPPHSGNREQQAGYGGGSHQGVLGRGPPAYNGNVHNGRGNGFGRGGWVRQR